MKNYVITIGRQFCSGGREIGRMLAKQLGIEFYDATLLREKARDDGLEEGIFDMFDEQPTRSFLFSVVMDPYAIDSAVNEGKVIEAQRSVICSAADKGPCVIVGRRADKILEERGNVLSVFICADMKDRIERYRQRDNVSEKAARRIIERKDKERASYYDYFGDGKWGKADNYALCFNSSKVSPQRIVDIICEYVQK